MSNYFLVNSETREIENSIVIDPENYETPEGYEVVADPQEEFCGIGNQYFGGDYNLFQPVEPLDSSWTKNSDGVWNEILNRPEGYAWDDKNSTWEDPEILLARPENQI